ncbi:hypothetical protein BDP27DRAFT_625276 [Rhodocollybia butyracea]|uniref:Uncharacterized protein n=1 Tax=Rhodocollybia butyracea TaxID=206335 RepID=A0A9P5PYB5_9AGAR|nr:hypothetical protein BDP27DRAFT_625276 [Rhodocollybia butyracea]
MVINSPCDIPSTSSTMRRHSVRHSVRPLRSSPLAGPALSSEGLVISNEDMQGKAKPSRISSASDLSSSSTSLYSLDWMDPIPHFPSPPHRGIVMPMFDKRKSSPPGFLAPISASSPSPSLPIPPITPPLTPKASSRPPSRENTKSFPGSAHTATPSNFPRVLHRNPSSEIGDWLSTNTFGETPRFSRVRMGSNVVMPISAKEYRRKSIGGAKSQPNHHKRPSSSHGTGSSGASASASSEETLAVQSSEGDKASKSNSTLGSARYGASEKSADSVDSMSSSQNSSFSSENGSEDTDMDMDSILRPPAPSSIHSSQSDCGVIDEETEDDLLVVSDLPIPLPTAAVRKNVPTTPSTMEHRHSPSDISSKSEQLTLSSRNNSFDSLKSRTKTILKRSKSFVHSRTTSTADSVLEPSSVAPRKGRHVKGLSFLSFCSSEESHQIAPVPPLPDCIYESNPDLANHQNGLLLPDTLSRPNLIHDDVMPVVPLTLMARRSVMVPPLPLNENYPVPSTSVLHSPSASSSFGSHRSPVTPTTAITPPSPSRAQSSKADQMLETPYGFRGVIPYASSSSLGSPTASSPFSSSASSPRFSRHRASSFLNVEEDEDDLPASRFSPKALSFLGVGEPPGSSAFSGSHPYRDPLKAASLYIGDTDPHPWSGNSSKATQCFDNPRVPRNKSETHLDTVLGFGGRHSTKSVQKRGTLKKLWKSLTGGKEGGKAMA